MLGVSFGVCDWSGTATFLAVEDSQLSLPRTSIRIDMCILTLA